MTKDEFIEKVRYYVSDEFLHDVIKTDEKEFCMTVVYGLIKYDLRSLEDEVFRG